MKLYFRLQLPTQEASLCQINLIICLEEQLVHDWFMTKTQAFAEGMIMPFTEPCYVPLAPQLCICKGKNLAGKRDGYSSARSQLNYFLVLSVFSRGSGLGGCVISQIHSSRRVSRVALLS